MQYDPAAAERVKLASAVATNLNGVVLAVQACRWDLDRLVKVTSIDD